MTTGTTQFLELESKLQKEGTFKKKKTDRPYILEGSFLFFFSSGGSLTILKYCGLIVHFQIQNIKDHIPGIYEVRVQQST